MRNQSLLSEINKSVDTLDVDFSKEHSFLLVYQTKKQKEWLELYGNIITCMDGVYKTLRYGFPCYFLVVKTSIGIVVLSYPNMKQRSLLLKGLGLLNYVAHGGVQDSS